MNKVAFHMILFISLSSGTFIDLAPDSAMNCLLSRQQLETVVEPVRAGLTRFIHRTLPLDEQIWEEYAKDYLGGGLEGHVYSQRCVATKTYRAVKSIVIKSNPMEKEAQRKGFDMFIKIAEITKVGTLLFSIYAPSYSPLVWD